MGVEMAATHTASTLDRVVLQSKRRPLYYNSMCGNRAESTNVALSISIVPLNKAIFGLGGLGFCQKM